MDYIKKGKLKIFFGYSPGVGKTYQMLLVARDLKKMGVDVVVGYIEPHDRPDTAKLVEGFETIPLKRITYKDKEFYEFDIDAAIKRHPSLILVDELAHTNVIGSKNTKRYLDVIELINHGIDVYTTVNVQHIEGLHDLVDSIIDVDVSERIPDEIFDYADEVVLIDIEPTDLIERMRNGKIYHSDRARSALEHFFTHDNLMSLRELFMRRGAERIEKKGIYPTVDTKILVLISPSPSSARNIRFAARMAEAYHTKYLAMYVETDGDLSDESASNLKKHMQLVRDTGGRLIIKYGDDVVNTVANFAKISNVTDLIIGKTWQSVGKKVGLEDKFIQKLPNLTIIILPDNKHNSIKISGLERMKGFFNHRYLHNKFRFANKALDVINILIKEAKSDSENKYQKYAQILSKAFERSVLIKTETDEAMYIKEGSKPDSFKGINEEAVIEWCLKNGKPAGCGTDTLANRKSIYFPVFKNGINIGVVGFSCYEGKMNITDRLFFTQIEDLLSIIL